MTSVYYTLVFEHIDYHKLAGEGYSGMQPPQPAKNFRLAAPFPRLGLSAYACTADCASLVK